MNRDMKTVQMFVLSSVYSVIPVNFPLCFNKLNFASDALSLCEQPRQQIFFAQHVEPDVMTDVRVFVVFDIAVCFERFDNLARFADRHYAVVCAVKKPCRSFADFLTLEKTRRRLY